MESERAWGGGEMAGGCSKRLKDKEKEGREGEVELKSEVALTTTTELRKLARRTLGDPLGRTSFK